MSRDIHKSRVYYAEKLVFAETLFNEGMGAAVVELFEAIVTSPWWRSEVVVTPTLEPKRREANHSTAHGSNKVRLAVSQEDAWTLIHELAHVAHSAVDRTYADQGHGPEFRRWYVDLTVVVGGQEAADRLAKSFIENGLPLAERTCAAPVAPGPYGLYGLWRALRQTGAAAA